MIWMGRWAVERFGAYPLERWGHDMQKEPDRHGFTRSVGNQNEDCCKPGSAWRQGEVLVNCVLYLQQVQWRLKVQYWTAPASSSTFKEVLQELLWLSSWKGWRLCRLKPAIIPSNDREEKLWGRQNITHGDNDRQILQQSCKWLSVRKKEKLEKMNSEIDEIKESPGDKK